MTPPRHEGPAREAGRLREAGDLPAAVALLQQAGDDAAVAFLRLRFLFELQDYDELQQATLAGLRRLHPAVAASDHQYLVALLRFAELCCLPTAELDAALDTLRIAARRDAAFQTAWHAVRHRLRYRNRLDSQFEGSASILSLGLNCLPWHLPGRWGFRRMGDFSALFGPFSLAGHTIPGVLAALEGDFAGYCDPDSIRIVRTQRGHQLAMRVDRTAHWNHSRGPYWLRDDAAPMRANLAAKAALFRTACRRPDAVFLLATCPVQYPAEPLDFLPRLDAALARFTGRSGNRILITNQTARQQPAGLHVVNPGTRFAYCPYPSAEYVWHDEAHADTVAGLDFERTYSSLMLRALTRWGLLRRKPDTGMAA